MSQISSGGGSGLPVLSAPNGNGNLGTVSGWNLGDVILGGTTRGLTNDLTRKYSGDSSLKIGAGTRHEGWSSVAQKTTPGKTYAVRVAYNSDTTWASGFLIAIQERAVRPLNGFITNPNGEPPIPATDRDSVSILVNEGIGVANTWIVRDLIYTVPAGVYWIAPSIYVANVGGLVAPPSASLWFDWSLDAGHCDMNPIDYLRLISRKTGISALTAGTLTPLFTVPANRSLLVTDVIIKANTVTGTVTTVPSISIGSNPTTYDNLLTTQVMTGAITTNRAFKAPIFGAMPIFPAGNIIQAQIDAAQAGATALTYDIELYGVLT